MMLGCVRQHGSLSFGMTKRPWLTPEELDLLLAEVVANQAAEGSRLTAEEIVEVRGRLAGAHFTRRTWSPSWDCLAIMAVVLRRPDMLLAGRAMEMFAMGVVIDAGISPAAAWRRIEQCLIAGQRGRARAVLELIEHGPPVAEKTDHVRFRQLAVGVEAARAAAWPRQLHSALGDD